jgi:small nuclear ribonucleoprotein (snRNP)-like protein
MNHFGKRVQITTKGGQTVIGRYVDYYNLHLCIDNGREVRWVALDRIKTMEPT